MKYPVIDLVATGKNIKFLRDQAKLKVEDVTEFMGLQSEQAIYKWQRGDSLPTVDNLFALSRLFGVPIEKILIEKTEGKDESLSLPAWGRKDKLIVYLISNRRMIE